MRDKAFWDEVWNKGDYKRGSTAQRLVPFLRKLIPEGSEINDYGCGTGRAEVELLKYGYSINMVDITDQCLDEETKKQIGPRLTFVASPLECLPSTFPIASWGIAINVLMTVEPDKLDQIMREMRRTCRHLIIENYDMSDRRLGREMTSVKGESMFWFRQMAKYWPCVESYDSPEHVRRYITVGHEK